MIWFWAIKSGLNSYHIPPLTTCQPHLLHLCLIVKPIFTSRHLHWPFPEPEKFLPMISKCLSPCHSGLGLKATSSKRTCLTSPSKCPPGILFLFALFYFTFSTSDYLIYFPVNLSSIPTCSPLDSWVHASSKRVCLAQGYILNIWFNV